MNLSRLERFLIVGVVLSVAYRHVTNEWPVSVEVE